MARLLACFDLFAQTWTQDGKSEATARSVSIFNLMVFISFQDVYICFLCLAIALSNHTLFSSVGHFEGSPFTTFISWQLNA